jgi:hypothetical protein
MTSAKKLIPDGHEDKAQIRKIITYYHVTSLVYYYNYLLSLFYILRYYSYLCSQCIYNRFLCAVLNIIPYIGPLIASVLAAVLTMLSNLGSDFQTEILPTTIYVLIGFG